jgi:methylmalonyl-CoA mutase N-terminal domain/subunit
MAEFRDPKAAIALAVRLVDLERSTDNVLLEAACLAESDQYMRAQELLVARTREVRRKRDSRKAQGCLRALQEGSRDPKENLMPLLVDAAREYVTLGEMCDALRETMGVYTDPAMF